MNQRLTVCHTLDSAEREDSGTSAAVGGLCRAQAALGMEVDLMTLTETGGSYGRVAQDGYRLLRYPPDLMGLPSLYKLGRSRALRKALRDVRPDIFHTHNLWRMLNVYPAAAAHRVKKPFVLSPHGAVGKESLAFSNRGKKIFWALWQKRAAHAADCLVATAQSEYEDIRAMGLTQPVAMISLGVEIPDLAQLPPCQTPKQDSRPFALSLSRVHQVKGLDRLVAAWAQIAQEFPDWHLRIVGPNENNCAEELGEQIAQANLKDVISIEGALQGNDKKHALMRQAHLFVLPTRHENFGVTIGEALSVGTPVITTKAAPWPGIVDNDCGWWIGHSVEELAQTLRLAMAKPAEELRRLGANGRQWMQRDFGWESIALKTQELYQWLLAKGKERPAFVID
ncbi:MAG: glycosyltransferase [Rhodobacteraceae bacterium]|nr:glycosyltransferase [Paracoccaceae bacterium]